MRLCELSPGRRVETLAVMVVGGEIMDVCCAFLENRSR